MRTGVRAAVATVTFKVTRPGGVGECWRRAPVKLRGQLDARVRDFHVSIGGHVGVKVGNVRGRKRKPTQLKILTGNPGRRPINANEPVPDVLDETPPAELADLEARREWTRTIQPAIRTGQISSADFVLATAHCELFAAWRAELLEASRRPHVIPVGRDHYPRPNPARVMANKTLALLASIDEKLGLTPTSRSKVETRGPRAIPSAVDKQRAAFFSITRG